MDGERTTSFDKCQLSFTVTGNRTLVAHFQAQSYTITASADPTTGGTVNGGGTFNYGQSCTLTATPASGYDFINWTKNGQQVSNNATYTFNVTESAAYVAHFQRQTFTVSLTANPDGAGVLTGDGTFEYGQTANIYAEPNPGYNFVNWTENGEVFTTDPGFYVVIFSDRNFVANFEAQTVDIKVNIDPADGGEVIGEGTYSYGDQVILTVTPYENYAFVNWTENGEVVCEEPTYTFTATTTRMLTVNLVSTEGVSEQNGKLIMYPNPVSDKLIVEAAETIDRLEIYNLLGALVYTGNDCTTKVEISVSDLPSGMYFVRLKTNNNTETLKFVKK